MKIFPAIDLFEKKAVRLYKGDYAQMTVYSENPPEVARSFRDCGAEFVHLVDLEGARDGGTPNFSVASQIAADSSLKVEIGGGIRDEDTIKKYLDAGVYRVILGTAAVTDPDFLARMAAKYGDRLAVGIDIKDGFAAIKGWREKSRLSCEDFCARVQAMGIKAVICTDISKDGAMQGTNNELYKKLAADYSLELIASGGVSCIEDIEKLREIGLYGAIVGKAYYTGALDLRKAIEVAR